MLGLAARFAREGFPDLGVFARLGRSLLRGQPLGELGFRLTLRLVDRALGSGELVLSRGHLVAQALELGVQRGLGTRGLRRRMKRTRVELAIVAVGALKPDRELVGDLELLERFGVVAPALMHRGVARAPEVVKQVLLKRADRAALPQPPDQLELRLVRSAVEPDLCRRALREHFAELAELEQADRRIRREVLLGLGRERNEPCVVIREVGEIRRRLDGHRLDERGEGSRPEPLVRTITSNVTPLSGAAKPRIPSAFLGVSQGPLSQAEPRWAPSPTETE